jgi:TPR repeat protein
MMLLGACRKQAEATPDEVFAASRPFDAADVTRPAAGSELIGAGPALAPDPRRELGQMSYQQAIEGFGYPKLRRWADELDPNAALFVAIAHIRGATGALRNDAQAEAWLLRAANIGAVDAQDALGLWSYREAVSASTARDRARVARMTVRAYAWFSLAQAHGSVEAGRHLRAMLRELQPSEKAVRLAQTQAAAWHRCTAQSCWDRELDSPAGP